jgi:hypothetical protein
MLDTILSNAGFLIIVAIVVLLGATLMFTPRERRYVVPTVVVEPHDNPSTLSAIVLGLLLGVGLMLIIKLM